MLGVLCHPPRNYEDITGVRPLLEDSLHHLLHKRLVDAIHYAQEAVQLASTVLTRARSNGDGAAANSAFVAREFCLFTLEFARYWVELEAGNYAKSWSKLQDAIDALRLVNKFTADGAPFHLSFFKHLCENIERIYPYRFFMSGEYIINRATCSICGLGEFDPDCEHLPGELYNGELAYRTVEDIEKAVAWAWVENPDDKRCVIVDPPPDFKAVEYYRANCPSPLADIEVTTTRPLSPKERVKVGRNDPCPCQSGRKYKKCCIGKAVVHVPHIHIEVGPLLSPTFRCPH